MGLEWFCSGFAVWSKLSSASQSHKGLRYDWGKEPSQKTEGRVRVRKGIELGWYPRNLLWLLVGDGKRASQGMDRGRLSVGLCLPSPAPFPLCWQHPHTALPGLLQNGHVIFFFMIWAASSTDLGVHPAPHMLWLGMQRTEQAQSRTLSKPQGRMCCREAVTSTTVSVLSGHSLLKGCRTQLSSEIPKLKWNQLQFFTFCWCDYMEKTDFLCSGLSFVPQCHIRLAASLFRCIREHQTIQYKSDWRIKIQMHGRIHREEKGQENYINYILVWGFTKLFFTLENP